VELLDGQGGGQVGVVSGNDKTSLTVTPPWEVEPASGTVYRLQPSERPVTRVSLIQYDISANLLIDKASGLKAYRAARLRIMVSMSGAGVLSVALTRAGVTQTRQLNAGQSLVANSLYTFDILVDAQDEVGLQYSVAATIQILTVQEFTRGTG